MRALTPLAAIGAPAAAVIGAVVGGGTAVLAAGVTSYFDLRGDREEREADRAQRELDRRNRRSDQLRVQMLNAATAFSTALEWIRARTQPISIDDIEVLVPILDQRLADGLSELGSISLLFGADSAVADAARSAHYWAIQTIATVRRLALVNLDDREEHELGPLIGKNAGDLSKALADFTRLAAQAVQRGPTWDEPTAAGSC